MLLQFESMLKETSKILQKQLEEEKAARLKAEENAEADKKEAAEKVQELLDKIATAEQILLIASV